MEEVPFYDIRRDASVIRAKVSKKQCPLRPDGKGGKHGFSDGPWNLSYRRFSLTDIGFDVLVSRGTQVGGN